ncbi:MAG: hypothetical protein ABIF92_02415, partial [archaeon]
MVRAELVKWIEEAMAKGHELEKLLANLKTQGYADIEIVELRNHISKKRSVAAPKKPESSSTISQVFTWIPGVFFEPEETLKKVAEDSRLVHVTLLGVLTIALVFITFTLKHFFVRGILTFPMQIMEKFTVIIAPQGSFAPLISLGEFTLKGIIIHLIMVSLHYFIPLLGIALVVHLLLHGLYHKSTMWKAYKIIGIPYGATAIGLSVINIATLPFLAIAEKVG